MIPMIALYSETHFRFGGISPSFLFKREPEVIFDCPARLTPGSDLPVMLLLNDVHRFPAEVISVELALVTPGKETAKIRIENPSQYEVEYPFSFRAPLYHFSISHDKLAAGWNTVHAVVTIKIKGKEKKILNDNLRTASQRPFSIYVANDEFPGSDRVAYGDLHTHSIHSNSHVEFGAPTNTVVEMATATGLKFTAITDHSYDLECDPNDYLKRDPNLNNWKIQQESSRESDAFTLICGEEISGRRDIGGVVHLGAFGHESFIHGSGDGARKRYRRSEEPSLQESAKQVISEGGVTFAAHPGERTSLLQRVLLRRGNWVLSELTESVTALQGINGGFDSFWYITRKLWVKALLAGKRIPLVGGNDAHGDFNRYRAIGFPFIYIKENFQRYFGLGRTGIYGTDFSRESLLESIRKGRTFITDGPYCSIDFEGESRIGSECERSDLLTIVVKSSEEFGPISGVSLIRGEIDAGDETVWFIPLNRESPYSLSYDIPADVLEIGDYLRLEVETTAGSRHFPTKAVSSALYLL